MSKMVIIKYFLKLCFVIISVGVLPLELFVSCKENSQANVTLVEDDKSDTLTADDLQEEDTVQIKQYINFANADEAKKYMEASENAENYSRGILPRMTADCLKYAEKLINSEFDAFIIVDKGTMKVNYYNRYGEILHSYGMACAKNYGTKHKKADSRTPEGFFSVEGVYDSTDWLFTDDEGVTSEKKGQFGPRFIRLAIPTTSQIGIHGTCAPWSIGNRTSHGCIRITNENIMELKDLVVKGMPVIVVPGKKDMIVNKEEGYDIPWVASSLARKKPVIGDIKPIERADTVAPPDIEIPEVESSDTIRNESDDSVIENKPDIQ